MLRPVAAVANCARAGKTSGLDIGGWRPVAGRNLNGHDVCAAGPPSAQAGGDRQRDAENSVIAGSPAPGWRSADPVGGARESRARREFFGRDWIEYPTKRCFFPVYQTHAGAL